MEPRQDIQLGILSSNPRNAVIRTTVNEKNHLKALVALLLLSLLSCIIHLSFQSIYIQELGTLLSILFELTSTLLKMRQSSKCYSFGWGRAKALSATFSLILLFLLLLNDLYLQLIIRHSESSLTLHSLVLVINLIQLVIISRSSGLVKIFLMWSSVSHVVCLCPFKVKVALVVVQSAIVVVLAWLESKDSIMELMESSCVSEPIDELESRIKTVEGVLDVHNFHCWSVGPSINLSFHVVANDRLVLKAIRSLCELSGFPDATIQFESQSFCCKSYKFIN